jgi:hypothetical protein
LTQQNKHFVSYFLVKVTTWHKKEEKLIFQEKKTFLISPSSLGKVFWDKMYVEPTGLSNLSVSDLMHFSRPCHMDGVC